MPATYYLLDDERLDVESFRQSCKLFGIVAIHQRYMDADEALRSMRFQRIFETIEHRLGSILTILPAALDDFCLPNEHLVAVGRELA